MVRLGAGSRAMSGVKMRMRDIPVPERMATAF